MYTGGGVLKDHVLLGSIVLSLLTMFKKSFDVVQAVRGFAKFENYRYDNAVRGFQITLGVLASIVLALFPVFIILKLVMIEECESHTWGLTTGCIQE